MSLRRSRRMHRSLFPALSTTCKIKKRCGTPRLLTHRVTITTLAWRASELDEKLVQKSSKVNVVNPTRGAIRMTSYSEESCRVTLDGEEDVAIFASVGGDR